ncbi:Hypothetical protein R9X50_00443000 [Acrodontium crateriforme]|uniref:Flavin-containing monooxygenase n=1 Tax=Acrodontium crateriforme TaxID=150365 RepID=A0AAQ3M636_9PEZI|nr:Hypothetical protein R9X50_00443000 [Acrodontium crateriforme]
MGSCSEQRRLKAESVCVIGAGPSGLAAAKYLLAERAFSRISILEQRSTVGGLWNYVPCPNNVLAGLRIPQANPHAKRNEPIWTGDLNSSNGLQQTQATFMTPVYDRLETNIPRGLMRFSDLEWPEDCQLFPEHEKVLEYIERFADDVRHLVKFQTQVLDVRLLVDKRWAVKSQVLNPTGNGVISEEIFDAVIVASGHFDVEHIPDVPGIREWNAAYPRSISHSKYYRSPEPYANKKVIVVGNSASGIDISAQIQPICKHPLLLSQKSESFLVNETSASKIDKPPIAEYVVENRTVKFADGTIERDVDAILYCTGYFYSLPFLDSLSPSLITAGERVENLYQHIFYRPQPTLSFLVLNQRVIPFPIAEAQSAIIARSLSGKISLPGEEEMKSWEEALIQEMGAGRDFHVLKYPKDANYINMLHDWAVTSDGKIPDRHPDNTLTGRPPPYWGEEEFWIRARFPQIKKAFNDMGDMRHSKRSLIDVGFDFDAWSRENTL